MLAYLAANRGHIFPDRKVLSFTPQNISNSNSSKRYNHENSVEGCAIIFISGEGRKYCLDATDGDGSNGLGRLINHSKRRPTLTAKVMSASLSKDGKPHLYFVARNDIAPYSPLCYDYNDNRRSAPNWLKN